MNPKQLVRVLFFMEQHLGHLSYYKNMHRVIAQSPKIHAAWVKVTYANSGGWWERLPFLPNNLRGTLTCWFQVRRSLSKVDYDVAFFNTQVPAVLAGSLVRKRPYVLSTDITPLQFDTMASQYGHQLDLLGPVRLYKHRANTRLFQEASRVLPWSKWTAHSLINDYGVSPERIEVVPPGVDLDIWRPGLKQRSGPLRILFVGGDFYRKGGDLLLKACDLLPRGTVELHIVTRSPVAQKEWVIVYNQMTPNSLEIIRLYQDCDIFVLPTKAEAFGIAAVEASATGLPVIAMAVGGLADIISHGETGYLINPGSTEKLIEYIQILAGDENLRKQLAQAARSKAETYFDANKNSNRVVEILCEIAGYSRQPS